MEFIDKCTEDENTTTKTKLCEYCNKQIKKHNFARHLKTCKNNYETLEKEASKDFIVDDDDHPPSPSEFRTLDNITEKTKDIANELKAERKVTNINGKEKKSFKCYKCGEWFQGTAIYQHRKTVHGDKFSVKEIDGNKKHVKKPKTKKQKEQEKEAKKPAKSRFFLTIKKPIKHYVSNLLHGKIPVKINKYKWVYQRMYKKVDRKTTYLCETEECEGDILQFRPFRGPWKGTSPVFAAEGLPTYTAVQCKWDGMGIDRTLTKERFKNGRSWVFKTKVWTFPYFYNSNKIHLENEFHERKRYVGYTHQTRMYARKVKVLKFKEKPQLCGVSEINGVSVKYPVFDKANLEKHFDFMECFKKCHTKTGQPKFRRWYEQKMWKFTEIKPLKCAVAKSSVVSNEHGMKLRNAHSHAYVELKKEGVPIVLFRKWFIRRCKFLIDIKTCKKQKMVYCTKEDRLAVETNLDAERMHDDYQMYQGCIAMGPKLDQSSYIFRKWKSEFKVKKLIKFHQEIWGGKHREQIVAAAKQNANPQILNQLTPSKRGIYIWGSPKRGKTSSVLAYTEGKHYQMSHIQNNFPFQSFQGEDYIVYEDVRKTRLLHDSRMINGLTDDTGFTRGERKGGDMFDVICRKVIITSNDEPPTEDEWPGFSRRFDVIKASCNPIVECFNKIN